jgi:hypothetical protein
MDTHDTVTQCINKIFGKAHKRIEYNLNIFKQLLLQWIIVNYIAIRQVECNAFHSLLFYLLACVSGVRSANCQV